VHPNKPTKARMQLAEISRKHKQKLWAEPQKLIRIKKAKGRAYYILDVCAQHGRPNIYRKVGI